MSTHPGTCFACGEGRYQEVIEDYQLDLPEGETLTVPNLLVLRCEKCGEESIPPESSRRIETAVDHHQDTLPASAIRAFLGQFQVDQTEAAEALGMGGKTFHRWARGTQRVSRSMGYFLRALMAHPEVYEWIRDRRWRRAEQAAKPPAPAPSIPGTAALSFREEHHSPIERSDPPPSRAPTSGPRVRRGSA